jgi:hypothetical protein
VKILDKAMPLACSSPKLRLKEEHTGEARFGEEFAL